MTAITKNLSRMLVMAALLALGCGQPGESSQNIGPAPTETNYVTWNKPCGTWTTPSPISVFTGGFDPRRPGDSVVFKATLCIDPSICGGGIDIVNTRVNNFDVYTYSDRCNQLLAAVVHYWYADDAVFGEVPARCCGNLVGP